MRPPVVFQIIRCYIRFAGTNDTPNVSSGLKTVNNFREEIMSITIKRILILVLIAAAGFCLGRLAVRAVLNLLLGGTLFGGNLL